MVPALLAKIPANLLWSYVILASIVAGVCEETGFRGYMQQPLERRYGPILAIVLTTIGFVAVHLNQTWIGALLFPAILASVMLGVLAYASRSLIPSMIGHAVMDVFNFGYWWWHLLGDYTRRPISETGIDLNFAAWAGTLVISLGLFVFVVRKLGSGAAREKHGASRRAHPLLFPKVSEFEPVAAFLPVTEQVHVIVRRQRDNFDQFGPQPFARSPARPIVRIAGDPDRRQPVLPGERQEPAGRRARRSGARDSSARSSRPRGRRTVRVRRCIADRAG